MVETSARVEELVFISVVKIGHLGNEMDTPYKALLDQPCYDGNKKTSLGQ